MVCNFDGISIPFCTLKNVWCVQLSNTFWLESYESFSIIAHINHYLEFLWQFRWRHKFRLLLFRLNVGNRISSLAHLLFCACVESLFLALPLFWLLIRFDNRWSTKIVFMFSKWITKKTLYHKKPRGIYWQRDIKQISLFMKCSSEWNEHANKTYNPKMKCSRNECLPKTRHLCWWHFFSFIFWTSSNQMGKKRKVFSHSGVFFASCLHLSIRFDFKMNSLPCRQFIIQNESRVRSNPGLLWCVCIENSEIIKSDRARWQQLCYGMDAWIRSLLETMQTTKIILFVLIYGNDILILRPHLHATSPTNIIIIVIIIPSSHAVLIKSILWRERKKCIQIWHCESVCAPSFKWLRCRKTAERQHFPPQ